MLRRARVIVTASLAVGMLPALAASCEILDGIGTFNSVDGSSAESSNGRDGAGDRALMAETATDTQGPCPSTGSCPCGMTPVVPEAASFAFCIDRNEVRQVDFAAFAGLVDAGKWEASAPCEQAELLPGIPAYVGQYPVIDINWCGAREYCRSIDASLCTGPVGDDEWDQWGLACGGQDHHILPYGDVAKAGKCNVADAGGPSAQLVPYNGGSCQGGFPKIFDLVGNVSEWGACDDAGHCAVRGGNARSVADADCLTSMEAPMGFQNKLVGFRCCASLRPSDDG
jgi:hypothetical protein